MQHLQDNLKTEKAIFTSVWDKTSCTVVCSLIPRLPNHSQTTATMQMTQQPSAKVY